MRFRLSTRWLSRPLIMVLPSPRRDQVIVDAQSLFGGRTDYSDKAPFFWIRRPRYDRMLLDKTRCSAIYYSGERWP